MRTERPTAPSLLRIAETLFAQMRAFGLLFGLRKKRDAPFFDEPTARRVQVVRAYLGFIEKVAGLGFVPGEVPLLYNSVEWPEGGEPGGYAGPDSGVRPSQMLVSYLAAWTMQWEEGYAPAGRIAKAAFWVYRARGVEAALRYVLALEAHGLVFDPRVATDVMTWLLRAYRSFDSDAEAVASLFGGTTPADARAWVFATPAPTFERRFLTRRELPARLQSALVEAALEHVEKVRESVSYDEWLLGQIGLDPLLSSVDDLCHLHWRRDDPSSRAVFDHLEEACADSGAVGISLEPTLRANLALVSALAILFRAWFPDEDWLTRLVEERGVVAYDLRRLLESDVDLKSPPPEWARVSASLAPVYLYAAHGISAAAPWRASPFTLDEVREAPALSEALARMNLNDPRLQEVVVSRLKDPRRGYWHVDEIVAFAPVLKAARGETWGLEQFADADPALLYDEKRSPEFQKWREEHEWRLSPLLDEVAGSLFTAELLWKFEEAWEVEGLPRLERMKALLELYPCHAPVLLEVGIAYDECGQPENALPYLEAAVVVNPTVELYWQSLGVVLRRLGESEGAAVAFSMCEALGGGERDDAQQKGDEGSSEQGAFPKG